MSEDFDKAYLRELAYKWKNGRLTDAEQQFLDEWENSHLDDLLLLSDDSGGPEAVKQRMLDHLLSGMAEVNVNNKSYRLWPQPAPNWLRGVAVAAAIVVGVWFFNYRMSPDVKSGDEMVVNDIAPGRNGATITLGNGKVIQLSDAKLGVVVGKDLKYSDSTLVIQSDSEGSRFPDGSGQALGTRNDKGGEDVVEMTAATARGQTYQFTLPDGTKVWLNADSKLEFPSNFVNSKTRNVKLSGEGYFEVAKVYVKSSTLSPRKGDLSQGERGVRVPFIVETDKQTVEVLGTHFNINSYADEGSVKTTLLEGSVKVSSLRGGTTRQSHHEVAASRRAPRNDGEGGERSSIVLKRNQQSILSGYNRITVKEVDANEATAWKNGLFVFANEPLESIMNKVGRWYDVKIEYTDEGLRKDTFTGTISRFSNISKVLERLERTGVVEFELRGKQVIVKK